MRPLFALLSSVFLLSGCAVSTITVLEKKETPKPFSKIMTVYIDNDIDFAVFDSLTYDICVRPAFMDTASLQTRGDMEGLLCENLSSPRSSVFRSSDLFGLDFNSYKDFISEMDSMGADAFLLVHIHNYTYSKHEISAPIDPRTGLPTGPSGSTRIPSFMAGGDQRQRTGLCQRAARTQDRYDRQTGEQPGDRRLYRPASLR
jgi:hypothetical protein